MAMRLCVAGVAGVAGVRSSAQPQPPLGRLCRCARARCACCSILAQRDAELSQLDRAQRWADPSMQLRVRTGPREVVPPTKRHEAEADVALSNSSSCPYLIH